jgi:folate-binding protein YgfZ
VKARRQLDVVSVSGPEAETYLQGQLSQNVATMAVGDCRYSLLLQPQGHIVAWFRIVRTGTERFALVADPGAGPAIAARLERFKLGTKATIDVETVDVVALRASRVEDLPIGSAVEEGQLAMVPLLWPDLAGVDLFGDTAASFAAEVDSSLVEPLRIGAGIPVFGADYDHKTVPAALGVVDLSTDFTKGCYTGQELVARMDSRGNNSPRQLRVLAGTGEPPSVGVEALLAGEPVATLTSVAAVGEGWLALASVKRSALAAPILTVGDVAAVVAEPLAGSGSAV